MKSWIGKILVTVLGLALLIYSATRSVDFISLTLPADKQILAWFGLAALDGGIIVWLLAFMYGSHGGAQRGISIIMVLVDFIGAVAMFTADTVFNTGKMGLTVAFDQSSMLTFVIMLSGIIAMNIGAGLAHHITDPDHMRRMADEEAHGKIEDMARDRVSKQSEQLASELAPVIADAWMATTRQRYMNAINQNSTSVPSMYNDPTPPRQPAQVQPPQRTARTIYSRPLQLSRMNGKVKQDDQALYNTEVETSPLALSQDEGK